MSSVMILSIVLLLISSATALSTQGYAEQDVDIEQWMTAKHLAEGCANTALQRIRDTSNYAGNESVTIGLETCTIHPILTGVTTTIQTEATVAGHPYRLEIELDNTTDLNVLSWMHVTSF